MTKSINGVCLDCKSATELPHQLTGIVNLGVAPGAETAMIFNQSGLIAIELPVTLDGSNNASINIPAADGIKLTALEHCCYKVVLLGSEKLPVNVTANGIEANCIDLCLKIDCESSASYDIILYEPATDCEPCNCP